MSDTAVVFSTFDPPLALVETVSRLVNDHPVVVVDDGGRDPRGVLPKIEAAGATVIRQERNAGIAAALNVALRTAFDGGADSVVTFDQDSTPSTGTIGSLRAALDRARSASVAVAGIVPAEFAQVRQTRSLDDLATARRVIQSGMLVPRDAFDELGPFDESLFIDLVDTDFEMRALSNGRRIVAAPTRIDHELGRTLALAPLSPLPPTVRTMVSTPFRYYYRMRNRLILTRRYGRSATGRMLVDLAVDLAYFLLVAASARPRRVMVGILGRGALDAVRGRRGRAPETIYQAASRVSWSTAE